MQLLFHMFANAKNHKLSWLDLFKIFLEIWCHPKRFSRKFKDCEQPPLTIRFPSSPGRNGFILWICMLYAMNCNLRPWQKMGSKLRSPGKRAGLAIRHLTFPSQNAIGGHWSPAMCLRRTPSVRTFLQNPSTHHANWRTGKLIKEIWYTPQFRYPTDDNRLQFSKQYRTLIVQSCRQYWPVFHWLQWKRLGCMSHRASTNKAHHRRSCQRSRNCRSNTGLKSKSLSNCCRLLGFAWFFLCENL